MGILRSRNLQIVIAAVVLAVTGGSLVGPILPAMLDPLDVSEERVGLVLSVYTFLALLGTPVLGMLADRAGHKAVLVPCLLLFGLSGAGIALVRTFWAVLFLRGVQGLAVAGMMNTGVTLIGDLFQGADRARAMGYRITFQTLTNTFVPFLSGGLAALAWFSPFLLYGLALPLALLAALQLRIEDTRATGDGDTDAPVQGFMAYILTPRAMWVFFSNLMAFVLLFAMVVYMPLVVVQRLGLGTLHSGLALSTGAGTAALVSSRAGWLLERYSEYAAVSLGFTLCCLALISVPFAHMFALLLGSLVVWGAGFGLITPALNTCAAGLAPAEYRGSVVSVFTATIYLGQSVSPPFFGFILASMGMSTVFVLASIIGVIPLFLALFGLRRQHPSHGPAGR
jgi:MFS family permease